MTTIGTDDDIPAGRRIGNARQERQMTQERFAREIGFSLSYVGKIESGVKDPSPAIITAAAQVLGVSRAELQGQPYREDGPGDQTHYLIEPIRRELAVYAALPTDEAPVPDLDALAVRVAEVSRLRHQVNLAKLGETLPPLLADLRHTVHTTSSTIRERAFGLLAETYAAASQMTYKLGHHDLSSIAVDRYEWAAARSADPCAVAVGDYQRAGELLNVGEYTAANAVLEAALHVIEGLDNRPAVWSTLGNLHLKAGLVAARSGHVEAVWHHYAAAEDAAAHLHGDRDDYRLAFGPSNLKIWGVGLAVELGDGDTAITRGRTLRLPRTTVAERRSHHHIDLARALVWTNNRDDALSHLYTARRTAPQHTRWHPQARETMRALDRLERRSRRQNLAELKHWFCIR